MSGASPPLRFLALVVGGWVCARGAALLPSWTPEDAEAASGPIAAPRPAPRLTSWPGPAPRSSRAKSRAAGGPVAPRGSRGAYAVAGPSPSPPALVLRPSTSLETNEGWSLRPGRSRQGFPGASPSSSAPLQSPPAGSPRWSFSSWAFARRGDAPALAPGGILGGSQAGARLRYRLNGDQSRPLSLSARSYAPLRRPRAAEAALGFDWKPLRAMPVHLLAERRQALGSEGRSAFSITAYGGVSEGRLGRLRLDAYAQIGVVGVRSRDFFADGSARVSLPIDGPLKIGAGAWAAAQPGVSRVDVGPHLAWRLPLEGRNVTLMADWRVRVAGDARPGSGPALTIATDF